MTKIANESRELARARCVDLTGYVCPMTFVRFKLEIDKLGPGDRLEIILKRGEQIQNVPRSIKAEGHQIQSVKDENGTFRIVVRKGKG